MIIFVIYRTTINIDSYLEDAPRTNHQSNEKSNMKLNEAGNIIKVMKSISRSAHITELEHDGMKQLLSNKSLQRVN